MPIPDLPAWFDGTALFSMISLMAILSMVWVYRDASGRGIKNAGIWAVSIGFLFIFYAAPGIAALVIYLLLRSTLERGAEETRDDSGL